MKKIVLATTVATACLLPLSAVAGTTLYGDLRYSINSVSDPAGSGNDGLVGYDNVSKFGLKGSYGEGVKAFFHLQTNAAADVDAAGDAFNQRFYFGGLQGGFGKVSYGRFTNAYKAPGVPVNIFGDTTKINVTGVVSPSSCGYGVSGATNGFTNNYIQYSSPKLGGQVQFNLGIAVDDSNEDEHGTAANIQYVGVKGLNVSVALGSNGTVGTLPGIAADGDGTRLAATYKMDNMKFGFNYEILDPGTGADDTAYMMLSGVFSIPNSKMDLKASIGTVDDGTVALEGLAVTAGAYYKVTENTQVYAQYSSASMEDETTWTDDPSVLAIGAIHKFSLGN